MTHEKRAREMLIAMLCGARANPERVIFENLVEASNDEMERRRAVDWTDQVEHFRRVMGLPVTDRPATLPPDRVELHQRLIGEEFDELFDALATGDLVGIADGGIDLIYVVIGMLLDHGIPLREVFAEVQRSNLAKLGPDGKPIIREDGKIIKPEDWTPPDIKGVLTKHGARL